VTYLDRERLDVILARIPSLRIAVIGDFFLDRYLVTDPALAEISVETGLEARQVVEVRRSPGAAGTVTNNLSALGVGTLAAFGVIGDDGEGHELTRALRDTRVQAEGLLRASDRFTPTYMKPMVRQPDGERELERLDIKNRSALSGTLEVQVTALLRQLLQSPEPPHAVIIADQVQERNCGVITDRVRDELSALARENPKVLFFADSRMRIGEFRDITIKPNRIEAARAFDPAAAEEPSFEEAARIGDALAKRNGRPVFLTLGADGMLVCRPDASGCGNELPPLQSPKPPSRLNSTLNTQHSMLIPSPRVAGPIDICGAGDSATAGIVCALCAGATPEEAAAMGNLCASVTIRKLGTTGTASPTELVERLSAYANEKDT
jgi:bifunctional ADP-heptose synthase (sugar kinase/adenylyltransferase)